jgi:integrase
VSTYLRGADELAAGLRQQASSPGTRRAYRADWARFVRWCAADEVDGHVLALSPHPPTCSPPTWPRPPTSRVPSGAALALHADARNRCLLLFGWAGALRRNELAGLAVSDVRWDRDDGLHLVIRSSKTDPEAEGAVVAVPFGRKAATCGPCLWARWAGLLAGYHGTDGGPG